MYSWLKLLEHEAARHAADIGHRIIAEDRAGQDDVVERAAEHVPLLLDGGVDQQKAGDRRHQPLVEHVDATRGANPVQLGVEEEQRHQAEPEDRDRMAGSPIEPRHMIDELAAIDGSGDAERNAEADADDQWR